MKQKHVAIILITVTILIILSTLNASPYTIQNNLSTVLPQTSYRITIVNGEVTRMHIIVTAADGTVITNGEIIIATAKNSIAYYTFYVYSDNTLHTETITMAMTPAPDDFVITYNDHYLTYNGISYYTQTEPPITFASSTTAMYSGTIIVEITEAIVDWTSTIT